MSKNVFVYGTLLSQYINPNEERTVTRTHERHEVLENYKHRDGKVRGYTLHWPGELSFPFMVSCENEVVIGEVYFDVGSVTIRELDKIEKVDSGFFRKVNLDAETCAEISEAVSYVAGDELAKKYSGLKKFDSFLAERK